jgi:hypothetical protein
MIRLATGSEASGCEASLRVAKTRPVPLNRYHLLRDGKLLDASGSRHTTRPAHAGVGGHQTTVSPLFFMCTHKPGSPLLPCLGRPGKSISDRRPVVSKRPLHSLAAAKMSPHIHIGPEPVLAAHARSPSAAGSRCPAGADSAPHSEQNFTLRTLPPRVSQRPPTPYSPGMVTGDVFRGRLGSSLLNSSGARPVRLLPVGPPCRGRVGRESQN